MANLLTVHEYKEIFGIKPKRNIQDDYLVTKNDINNGTIFQSFRDDDSLTNIIKGLSYVNNEVCLIYPKISRIEIDTDDKFPPCGGKQEVAVYAFYSLYCVKTDGTEQVYSDERKDAVNAIIRFDNDLFSYDRPYVVKDSQNDTEDDIECTINATYYSNGNRYTASKQIVQNINKLTSWILIDEPTPISIRCSRTSFNNRLSKTS